MRYGIEPQGPVEQLALWLGLAPLPVLDVLLPLLQVRCLMAAVKHGVFEELRATPRTSAALAERLKLAPESVEALLRVLASSRYLKRRGSHYCLTRVARATLLRGAPKELRSYVALNYAQWRWIEGLEEMLQTGTGIKLHDHLRADAETWGTYQQAMLELARPDAELVARRIPVRAGATQLLDFGGGHGLFGAAICRAHPPLKSTVLELEAALPEARRLAAAAGICDVVTHRAADVTAAELGDDVDVALLCNLLHHLEREARSSLLRRIYSALAAGGTIAIWEPEAPSAGAPPELAGDAVALYFRITSSAPPLAAAELEAEVVRAGFAKLELQRPLRARGRLLLHARKPR